MNKSQKGTVEYDNGNTHPITIWKTSHGNLHFIEFDENENKMDNIVIGINHLAETGIIRVTSDKNKVYWSLN